VNDRYLPILIHGVEGRLAFVGLANEKSIAKTVERHKLWHVHPDTGRVLPLGDPAVPVESVVRHAENSTILWASGKSSWSAERIATVRTEYAAALERAGHDGPSGTREPATDRHYKTESVASEPTSLSPAELRETGGAIGTILNHLAVTIHQRRQHRPEGSYTTHLFEKGEEQIRKKTGEEAVEMLLARSDDDLLYEAADLIFHLLVLLEARDLSIDDVGDQLRERF
jgi:phosphoribosyl-ATP pyrophosphohydrolase